MEENPTPKKFQLKENNLSSLCFTEQGTQIQQKSIKSFDQMVKSHVKNHFRYVIKLCLIVGALEADLSN